MATNQNTSSYVVPDAVVGSEVLEEAVLLNLGTGVYHSLDAVGTLIWTNIERGRSVEEIVDALLLEYDVPEETAARDVQQFLDELIQLRLLEQR